MTTLLVVGGGKMGSALITGLLAEGLVAPSECVVADPSEAARRAVSDRFPGIAVAAAPIQADGVILAVKPADLESACASLATLSPRRVLSIVAGVPIERLEGLLGTGVAVVRAMPNTPALLRAGASAVSGGKSASEEDVVWAESVLGAVGEVVRLPERLLDAVTGLSGSGPAYIFLIAEALIDAGVHAGLDRETSKMLSTATLLGAARMLAETGDSAEQLRAAVTSPGGTTAAGLRVLEQRGVRAAFLDAVAAATERSRALGAAPS